MQKPYILYVEDEPDYQVLVCAILAEVGLETETALTAEEGLDRLAHRKPTLLILDVNLPDTSGYDLCSRIRQEEAWAEIPILMLTVRRRPSEWLEGFSCGADDYLSKPFNPPELIERVQNLLSGKPVRRLNPSDPEHLLIEAALAGNRPAFEVLITRYKRPLMNYVRQSVRGLDATEDIVSASFAHAFHRLDHFRGDATFFTWLYTIADNEIRDHWLNQSRAVPALPDDSEVPAATAEPDPPAVTDDPQQMRAIRRLKRAIHDLPPEFRQPLRMHCLRRIPVRSVSQRLRIPPATVLTRIFRGKMLLRQAFRRYPRPDAL